MNQTSFVHFILGERRNRQLLGIALVATILQFIIFKFFYPFADFFSDSYSYIYAASANLDIGIWPIGYSKFLMAFHSISQTDTSVVTFQYFFLESSCLYFFFTILFFYNPGRTTRNILFVFLFFNPLFLYISNYINSDPLFAALSLFWVVQLLWIINRPKLSQLFTQAILLFLCFTIRNNAYYYPFITLIAFILSRQLVWRKVVGSLMGVALIVPFILAEQSAAYKITGTRQFSLFTGWQLANNALYMYGHIDVDSNKLPSQESRNLDQFSRKFYSKMPPDFSEYLSAYVANFFIRQPQSPLKQYFNKYYQSQDEDALIADWGKASVVFNEYGTWLIKHHPVEFARYFMLLNAKNYFMPPLEKLEVYNLGQDDVSVIAQDWFGYKTSSVSAVSKTLQGRILFFFPYLFFFLNVLFAGSLIWWFYRRRSVSLGLEFNYTMILSVSLLLANTAFCIFATIIVLRYQFFPMIITLTFPLLLIELLDKKHPAPNRNILPNPEIDSLKIKLL
jgi:hypothetical protein